jgi:hypothetical protein
VVTTILMRGQEIALCVVRKWWRPVTCIGIAGGAVVNLVYLPLHNHTTIDLTAGAAFVTACAAAFAVREVGKAWGTADAAK